MRTLTGDFNHYRMSWPEKQQVVGRLSHELFSLSGVVFAFIYGSFNDDSSNLSFHDIDGGVYITGMDKKESFYYSLLFTCHHHFYYQEIATLQIRLFYLKYKMIEMEKEKEAFQDLIGPDNHCHGCGTANPKGLHLKSYWDGDEAIAKWKPASHHTAGSPDYVNGGILASLIDCHSNNLAMAASYHRAGRSVGSDPRIWCVTAQISIDYKKPVPIDQEIHLRARILKNEGRKTRVECLLVVNGQVCVKGDVLLVEIHR